MKQPLMVAAMIVGGLGCLFALIGLATPAWATAEGLTVGLFVQCVSAGCVSYTATGRLQAVKAFVIIAFLCSLAATIDSIIYYVKNVMKDVQNRTLPLVSGIFFCVAAFCAFLGPILFATSDVQSSGFSLGYSFALTIIAFILCGVAGGLTIYHRQKQTS